MPHRNMEWRCSTQFELFIANRRYSSWSMRAWLLLRASQLTFDSHRLTLFSTTNAEWREQVLQVSPSGKLPVLRVSLRHGDNVVTSHIHETAAIVDRLQSIRTTTPPTHIIGWPRSPHARAHAHSIVAELNSSFIALRDRLPFNCATFERVRREPSTRVSLSLDERVQRDIDRIFSLLRQTKTQFSNDAAWLFGDDITIPDVWFAVTAIRLTAYIAIPSGSVALFFFLKN